MGFYCSHPPPPLCDGIAGKKKKICARITVWVDIVFAT